METEGGRAPGGVRSLAHQVRSHTASYVAQGVSRLQDDLSGHGYARFDEGGGGEEQGEEEGEQELHTQEPCQGDEDTRSDVTEGHDGGEQWGEVCGYQMDRGPSPLPPPPPPLGAPLEAALAPSIHGEAQLRLLVTLGLALAGDGAERLLVWRWLPGAEREACGSNGWLCILVQLSLTLGSLWWGAVSDVIGRRPTLLATLTLTTTFSLLSLLTTSYGQFLTCRVLGALGMGGVFPVSVCLLAESVASERRLSQISWLLLPWALGTVMAAVVASATLHEYGWGSPQQWVGATWRGSIAVSLLPGAAAIASLFFVSTQESSVYLLQCARTDEAVTSLNVQRSHPESGSGITDLCQLGLNLPSPSDITEVRTETGTWYQRLGVRVRTLSSQALRKLLAVFSAELRSPLLWLLLVWFNLSFSACSTFLWVPSQLESLLVSVSLREFKGEVVVGAVFNFSLSNQRHVHGVYREDRFVRMHMARVWFQSSLFQDCVFDEVSSTDLRFSNCTVTDSVFIDTDIPRSAFEDSVLINTTFLTRALTTLTSKLTTLARTIPRLLAGLLLVLAVVSALLVSGVGEGSLLLLLSGCSMLTLPACAALLTITSEAFPTHARATALSTLAACGRVAELLGAAVAVSFVGSATVGQRLPLCLLLLPPPLILASVAVGRVAPRAAQAGDESRSLH